MTDSTVSHETTAPISYSPIPELLTSPEEQFKHIVVKHPENGIHELIFKDSTLETVDELFAYLIFLNSTVKPGQIYYQLWDARVGLLPISKTIQESRKLLARFPKMGAHRMAVIYPKRQNTMLQPGSVLLNMLPLGRLKIHYFSESNYDAAITWLLSGK
jgi:hypothetical protein